MGYRTAGIVVLVIGIILLIVGVVILALDQSNQKTSEWWVWALIVIGVIALIVGIALFFIPSPKTTLERRLEMRKGGVECPGVVAPGAAPRRGLRTIAVTPIGENGVPCPPALRRGAVAPVAAPPQAAGAARISRRAQLMPTADLIQSRVYCPQFQQGGAGVVCPPSTAYGV